MHPALEAEFIDPSPPPLQNRAVSLPFLLSTLGKLWPEGRKASLPSDVSQLPDASPEPPAAADGRSLRDLKVWEVAEYFIKPATATGVSSFVQVFIGCKVG